MPRRKSDLNTIYITKRLQEYLHLAAHAALITVVAPMGYGKTTAVNWYLGEREKEGAQVVRISVYSDNLAIFWRSVQEAFARAGLDFLKGYDCPVDTAGGSMLADDLCHELENRKIWYLFIDDFHLLTDSRAAKFLGALARRLPENVHLMVAGRAEVLSGDDVLLLGSRLCRVGTEQLRLHADELSVYARRCGTKLSERELESLLYSSEGWFSAVYLNLQAFAERGALPTTGSDIYTMFTAAMLESKPEEQQEFLAVLGLADEFTIEMAEAVTGQREAGRLLGELMHQNAFVKRLPDSDRYRFHHMMKECAGQAFERLDPKKRSTYRRRYGDWYERHGQYLHAIEAYRLGGDYDGVLRVIRKDAGILLSSLASDRVLTMLDECPDAVCKLHPASLLVLMRCMFNWQQIPKMLELKGLLTAAIEGQPDMPAEERDNLLGECDLIQSFLFYNDISAMSRLHRSASARMTHPAISIRNSGGWTFGSPSVLMMFHRTPGGLKSELAQMEECMPHYYRITDGHGQSAERIMSGEAALMQGRLHDAQIELERAYAQIEDNGQENMALCCDFLELRLSLGLSLAERQSFEERRAELTRRHNAAWMKLWNSTCAYYYALLGETELIPEIFRLHRLHEVNLLAPGRPMIEMIENQVYLAQGSYARVIGRSEGLLKACRALHYSLVELHIRIQTAAAYGQLGKRDEAEAELAAALALAKPDGLVWPFAENYRYLKRLQPLGENSDGSTFLQQLCTFGKMVEERRASLGSREQRPAIFEHLTGREAQIAELIAEHRSNREIAEELFLSEGSVKQYINQIYAKLLLTGEPREKRRQLAELVHKKP